MFIWQVTPLKDHNFTTTMNGSDIFLLKNGNHDQPTITKVPRNFSGLDKLESNLVQARAAIRDGQSDDQIDDPDYTPYGPIYWNSTLFHTYALIFTFFISYQAKGSWV